VASIHALCKKGSKAPNFLRSKSRSPHPRVAHAPALARLRARTTVGDASTAALCSSPRRTSTPCLLQPVSHAAPSRGGIDVLAPPASWSGGNRTTLTCQGPSSSGAVPSPGRATQALNHLHDGGGTDEPPRRRLAHPRSQVHPKPR